MKELGYPLSRNGSHGENGVKGKMIGLLSDLGSDEMVRNEFQHRFLSGVEAAVSEGKGHLMFASCSEDLAKDELPAMVKDRLVSGVVLKISDSSNVRWLARLSQKIPVVLLMHSARGMDNICSVMCDNAGGMYQSLRYLYDLGHRRIGFLSIRDYTKGNFCPNLHNSQRLRAFMEFAPEFHLPENPAFIQNIRRDWETKSLSEAVSEAMDAWLAMGEERPTAVICAADLYAFAFMEEARKRCFSIPADFSVTGFMNTVDCEHSQPPLTSISLQGEEVGRAAVELLDYQARHPDGPMRHLIVSSRLVERVSCSRV